jgi:hypothetical protein
MAENTLLSPIASAATVELHDLVTSESTAAQEDVMTAKTFSTIAAVLFTIFAVVQLTRALSGWELTIGSAVIPMWPSYVVGLVFATLAWLGFTARE